MCVRLSHPELNDLTIFHDLGVYGKIPELRSRVRGSFIDIQLRTRTREPLVSIDVATKY